MPEASTTSPRDSNKKQRLESEAIPEDLDCSGYTSSDSYSKDHVWNEDWRVYQVKTRNISTSKLVTQYWHWVVQENMFEHQVLKDVKGKKISWGVYKEPINLHLHLSELTEVVYASGSQKIIIGTKPIENVAWRGDVLAHFKRDRTKRRFLTFIQSKGVRLIKSSK